MPRVDRDRALRSQILLANACKNLLFELRQSVATRARNSNGWEILPVVVLRQIALVQDNDFVRFARCLLELRKLSRVEMHRPRHIAISNVQAQISDLQRFLCTLDPDRKSTRL